ASGALKHRMVRAWDEKGSKTDILDWTAVAVGMAYSPDGKTLATHSTGRYGWLAFWDAARGEEVSSTASVHHRQRGEGGAVAYSPDGKMLAAGYGNGYTMIKLVGPPEKELYADRGPVGRASVAICPDSKLLAVGGGGSLRLVDLPTGRVMRDPFGLRGKVIIT